MPPGAGQDEPEAAAGAGALHWLERNPDLRPAAVADGARDSRAFLESPGPDVTLVDFWYAAQHVKVAADAAFGPDTAEGTAWSGRWRHVPPHDPRGVGRVTGALRHLPPKGRGTDDVRREPGFLRSNRRRMEYAAAAEAGHPIGSGSVEAANRVLVTARMKRSGQSWGRDGGQGARPSGRPRVRTPPPGLGRAGSGHGPPRRLEATGMRQRQSPGGAGRARRVIRGRNAREPKVDHMGIAPALFAFIASKYLM